MYMQFNEPNPAKWQDLIKQYFPNDVAIAVPIKGGVVFFETMPEFYEWKAAQ